MQNLTVSVVTHSFDFFLTPAFSPLQRAVMSKEPTKVQGGKNSTEEEGALPRRRNLSDITVLSVLC